MPNSHRSQTRMSKFLYDAAALLRDGKELIEQRLGRAVPLLTRSEIIGAYRAILDREPADDAEIEASRKEHPSLSQLRWRMLASDAYRSCNPPMHVTPLSGDEPPMQIEEVDDNEQLQALVSHVQEAWQHLGETEPYWSVIAGDEYRMANIERTRDQFYRTGQSDVERVRRTLERNGIQMSTLRTCLEYGCGVGRVTRWLTSHFAQVYAYDISLPHLRSLERDLRGMGKTHVVFKQTHSVEDLSRLPKVDFVYSLLVLQHNPPPVIALIIEQLLRALHPGGYAYFQVPTYRLDYSFQLADYLENEGKRPEMETHVLPQRKIFELILRNGAQLVEVLEDGHMGVRYRERSNTFLIRKLAAEERR